MRKMSKKSVTIIASTVLVLALAIGATLAYLQDATGWYSNTFEFAEGITVTLDDEATNYKIVPGRDQAKNTSVTISNEDVDSYLFLIVKDVNTNVGGKQIVEWSIADGWTPLAFAEPDIGWDAILPSDDDISEDNTSIFYREVPANDSDSTFAVLSGNKVSYPLGLSREDVPDGTQIKLNFAARAIQQEGFDNAAKAWIGEETALPNASMNALDPASVGVVSEGNFGDWSGELDTAVSFVSHDTMEGIEDKDFKDWTCDFILTFNQDVDKSKVHVFGQYDAFGSDWVGGPLGASETLPAGEEVRVIEDWLTGAIPGVTVSYSDVVSLGTFNCGVAVEDAPAGLTATLQLIMIDGEGTIHTINSQTINI